MPFGDFKTIPTPPSSLAVDDSSKYKVHCPSSTVAISSISPGISSESSIGSFDGPVDLQKLAPLSRFGSYTFYVKF